MTKEELKLLLIDLCGRLSYGVIIKKKVCHTYQIEELNDIGYGQRTDEIYVNGYPIEKSKPYLRPMSSMTEEEINEFILISDTVLWLGDKKSTCILSLEQMDWLNSHHFDYRGLIPMGLALEVPDDMYKMEQP